MDDVASFSLLFLSAIESVTIASNVLLSFVFPFNDDDDAMIEHFIAARKVSDGIYFDIRLGHR